VRSHPAVAGSCPSNIAGLHFHGLQGKPKRWSMRVTGNYRITFGWSGETALDVDFEDYH